MHSGTKKKKEVHCQLICFGAGGEVGRSSILVEIGSKKVLLDCGVNFTATDEKDRLPAYQDPFPKVDLVLISHIHTDHLAAVPYLTEVLKCQAPVYMTRASQMMMPIMLDDFLKVTENPPYKAEDLTNCKPKIKVVEFYSRFEAAPGIFVQAFPAGHILGAACFFVQVRGLSFIYTGDFSAIADHHLSGHAVPRLFPDLLITESTYGNQVRDSIAKRERSFVQMVHQVVGEGGKVLIPVFAVGRLQEICLMLEDYWNRMGYTEPIYYTTNLGENCMKVYKQCVNWMNPTVQTNLFDNGSTAFKFTYSRNFNPKKSKIDESRGLVMLATSGMLNPGTPAFNFFVNEKWYDDPRNMVIFPGYCGPNTFGRAVLTRDLTTNRVQFTSRRPAMTVDIIIKCKVERISFSAHADQFEIISLCDRVRPSKVVTIHGDKPSVDALATRITQTTGIPAEAPRNNAKVTTPTKNPNVISISRDCVNFALGQPSACEGVILKDRDRRYKMISLNDYKKNYSINVYKLNIKRRVKSAVSKEKVAEMLKKLSIEYVINETESVCKVIAGEITISFLEEYLEVSFPVGQKTLANKLCCLIAQ
ncbi:RNA-metabolising metallo-beta-lactamase family protein [Trichomonas vaginalis G3]|uniref:RNA-metabolising metallo-beta-lactamase family protein n=1 Tax=Trichomonas vaginalis (strain ATCC PRA-98 / G3) TaxID=412133 RepID=A2D958_TRIV3|nr:cleavage and polyadenylation specificity factor family member family [Trichomonas vaginalis G3]EAY23084.1 RNA-metabolising metallo-beta-lactamase family protein [Trichomonas vaginalis G3]KAI5519052.1 cleavage and polyadenylation specificity factor family member family [Trichomonas vaginalis G3]|eukprot:XP_001584070.1 RNA-metabolising metallo-beta-lactamase family protein [Trichomonas vaginalis G3]